MHSSQSHRAAQQDEMQHIVSQNEVWYVRCSFHISMFTTAFITITQNHTSRDEKQDIVSKTKGMYVTQGSMFSSSFYITTFNNAFIRTTLGSMDLKQ